MAGIEIVDTLVKLKDYAWPFVALMALPFAIWKIGSIAKSLVALHELASNKGQMADLVRNLEALPDYVKDIKALSEELQGMKVARQIDRTANESPQEQAATINELSPADPATPEQVLPQGISVAEMKNEINDHWTELQQALEKKLSEIGLKVDFRSPQKIGVSLVHLFERDGRQTRRLRRDDAELIAVLASGRKSVNYNADWLTPEYFNRFCTAADGLKTRVKGWKPSANQGQQRVEAEL